MSGVIAIEADLMPMTDFLDLFERRKRMNAEVRRQKDIDRALFDRMGTNALQVATDALKILSDDAKVRTENARMDDDVRNDVRAPNAVEGDRTMGDFRDSPAGRGPGAFYSDTE